MLILILLKLNTPQLSPFKLLINMFIQGIKLLTVEVDPVVNSCHGMIRHAIVIDHTAIQLDIALPPVLLLEGELPHVTKEGVVLTDAPIDDHSI